MNNNSQCTSKMVYFFCVIERGPDSPGQTVKSSQAYFSSIHHISFSNKDINPLETRT